MKVTLTNWDGSEFEKFDKHYKCMAPNKNGMEWNGDGESGHNIAQAMAAFGR